MRKMRAASRPGQAAGIRSTNQLYRTACTASTMEKTLQQLGNLLDSLNHGSLWLGEATVLILAVGEILLGSVAKGII